MFSKIIICILIIIILIFLYNYLKIYNGIENFINNNTVDIIGKKNIQQSKLNTNKNLLNSNKLSTQQIAQIDNRILFNNKDYNENLSIDNKDNKYYYNDMIDQSNINETAFNVVYSIDPIDYADVKTGITKCNKNCKGICFENGYDGISTCYPTQSKTFDWGTLYKNPEFTYGYNAYGPENLPQ